MRPQERGDRLLRERLVRAAILVMVAALWETAARAGWIPRLFFPPPSKIGWALLRMASTGALWPALGSTLGRMAAGVFLGGGAGLALGWLMGVSRPWRTALDPVVAVLHPVPKLALFPIFLVLLGIGEASKVALTALTAFFPVLLNTMSGVRRIDRSYWEAAANYGATGTRLVRRVILPGSLPSVLVGVRLAVNSTLVVAIAVEMLSAREGLGATIWLAWQTLRTEDLYAVLIVIGGLGWAGNRLLESLTKHMLPWEGEST